MIDYNSKWEQITNNGASTNGAKNWTHNQRHLSWSPTCHGHCCVQWPSHPPAGFVQQHSILQVFHGLQPLVGSAPPWTCGYNALSNWDMLITGWIWASSRGYKHLQMFAKVVTPCEFFFCSCCGTSSHSGNSETTTLPWGLAVVSHWHSRPACGSHVSHRTILSGGQDKRLCPMTCQLLYLFDMGEAQ